MSRFEIPGEPYGKGRPRFTRSGQIYTPKKTRDYEKMVQHEYLVQTGGKLYDGPIVANIYATCAVPKSDTKKNRGLKLAGHILPTKTPDCDNIAKTILDALNGIAYKDDSQIIQLHVYKKYGETGKTEVELHEPLHDARVMSM